MKIVFLQRPVEKRLRNGGAGGATNMSTAPLFLSIFDVTNIILFVVAVVMTINRVRPITILDIRYSYILLP